MGLDGVILDEIQHAPGLLLYIQTIVDREKKMATLLLLDQKIYLLMKLLLKLLQAESRC